MTNILFICGKNKIRSLTAENIFADYPNIQTRSAGINSNADYIVTPSDVEWANLIFVMEAPYANKLRQKFKDYIKDQKIINLNIPDKYKYMQPELISILKRKVENFL